MQIFEDHLTHIKCRQKPYTDTNSKPLMNLLYVHTYKWDKNLYECLRNAYLQSLQANFRAIISIKVAQARRYNNLNKTPIINSFNASMKIIYDKNPNMCMYDILY